MLHCKSSPVLKAASRGTLAPVALPVRPLRPCRFKGDDAIEEAQRKAKDTQQKAAGQLKQTQQKVEDKFNDTGDSVKRGLQDSGNSVQHAAQDITNKVLHATDGAYSTPKFDAQYKVSWLTSAFTRRREVFAGRLAIAGFVAAGFWEWLLPNHPNMLQQVQLGFLEVGLPVPTGAVLAIFGAVVAYNAFSASVPWSPTWSEANQKDVSKRPAGPNNTVNGGPVTGDVKGFFGITGIGFSKANEVFVSRMAMLGFAAALVGQLVQGGLEGPGYIAQVANYLNVDPEFLYAGVPKAFIGWSLLMGVGAYLNDRKGTLEGEEDIY